MGEGDLLCAARPPERPAQVHRHHAEDGAVAVAERVDGVDAREPKKDIKQRPPSNRPSTMCGRCRSAMAPKRKRTTTRRRQQRRRRMKGGTVPFIVDFKKGFQLLTNRDTWKIPSKADAMAARRQAAILRRVYHASGSKDSYETWAKKKGYIKRPECSLM